MGIIEYLEAENRLAEESRIRWHREFDLFCELTEFYERLCSAIKISDKKVQIPSELFLVIMKLMYGVVSQILRGRHSDAWAQTRGAIEAAAISYRLSEHPELIEIYHQAYPNVEKQGDPKQWKISADYSENFKTSYLFSQGGSTWNNLKVFYEMFSAMATHAGPAALSYHETREDIVFLSFLGSEEQEIKRCWHSLILAYYEILRVFLLILRDSWSGAEADMLGQELLVWRDKVGVLMEG
ncbi:MAG TPA: hypothetical protein VI584_09030 [Nitrospiria bacterium]|nr:hypothetical protein [Nitrospiria bacterium]